MKTIDSNIDKNLVVEKWRKIEWQDQRDGSANERLTRLAYGSYKCDLIEIESSDFSNIILPDHDHDCIKCDEITLEDFRMKYFDQFKNLTSSCDCFKRFIHLRDRFDSFSSTSKYLEGKFMYLTKNLKLSVKSRYELNGYYTGSFHQFSTYAIWTKFNGDKPLRLFEIQ